MTKKSLNLFLVFLLIALIYLTSIFIPRQVVSVSSTNISVNAVGAVVIESDSLRVLAEKNKDQKLAMASTTKIMTALVAIENTQNLDEIFDVDNRAVGIEGTSIYLKKDERLSMRHLLLGLMLSSGNDASLAIGYKIGNGNLDAFVDLMNKKCDELNLHNTHFDNPHGLDSQTHYTTAYDLAVITAKAMENEIFRDIVKTKIAQIPSATQGESRFLRNKHKLLQSDFDGCEGVKTGFTDNALRCCVTSCQRNGMRLICVVLNCPNMFEDSATLINSAFQNYSKTKLLEANKYIESLTVKNCNIDTVKTYTKSSFEYPLKESELDKINTKVILPECIETPTVKDSEIGEYKIYLGNDLIFEAKIYTMEDVSEKEYSQKIKDIIENWS